MTIPDRPFAIPTLEFSSSAPITAGGRTKTLAQWHNIAQRAHQILASDPSNTNAREALSIASSAVHEYARALGSSNQLGRRTDMAAANDPGAVKTGVAHAANAASLGLGGPISGIAASVTSPIAGAFGPANDQYEQQLDEMGEKHEGAAQVGNLIGGAALGAGTELALAGAPSAAFGAGLGARARTVGKAALTFGGEGAVRGATGAHGGDMGERAGAALFNSLIDGAAGGAATGSAFSVRDRLMRPAIADRLLVEREGEMANRQALSSLRLDAAVAGRAQDGPLLPEGGMPAPTGNPLAPQGGGAPVAAPTPMPAPQGPDLVSQIRAQAPPAQQPAFVQSPMESAGDMSPAAPVAAPRQAPALAGSIVPQQRAASQFLNMPVQGESPLVTAFKKMNPSDAQLMYQRLSPEQQAAVLPYMQRKAVGVNINQGAP